MPTFRGVLKKCRHCGKLRRPAAKGLCHSCYKKVAARYPKLHGNELLENDQSLEELDALIASRYPTMPIGREKPGREESVNGVCLSELRSTRAEKTAATRAVKYMIRRRDLTGGRRG